MWNPFRQKNEPLGTNATMKQALEKTPALPGPYSKWPRPKAEVEPERITDLERDFRLWQERARRK